MQGMTRDGGGGNGGFCLQHLLHPENHDSRHSGACGGQGLDSAHAYSEFVRELLRSHTPLKTNWTAETRKERKGDRAEGC